MPTYTQPNRIGDVLKREFDQLHNRETVTVLSGQTLAVGAVVGKVTASGKWKEMATSGTDGSQNAAGVLLVDTNASAADALGVILARGPAVVSAGALVWPVAATQPQKDAAIAALAALGITVRATV
jgi:hypothetical protein